MSKPIALLLVSILTSCTIVIPISQPQELVQVNAFDDTRWQRGVGAGNSEYFITEAVPKGQTVDDWEEMITLQFYSKHSHSDSIEKHLRRKEGLLVDACPDVEFVVLYQRDEETAYQWSVDACEGQEDQCEWARFIKTDRGVHRIAYTHKAPPHDRSECVKWLRVVEEAHVVEVRDLAD
jgi:hypothetical protein